MKTTYSRQRTARSMNLHREYRSILHAQVTLLLNLFFKQIESYLTPSIQNKINFHKNMYIYIFFLFVLIRTWHTSRANPILARYYFYFGL